MEITPLHVARGKQMRAIVRYDIATRRINADAAMQSLADYLGIDYGAVKLAIAIANEADQPGAIISADEMLA